MTVNDFIAALFILLLIFLFDGEPDVWDHLQAAAMGVCF